MKKTILLIRHKKTSQQELFTFYCSCCEAIRMFCLFILLIQQIIVNGTVTHGIVPADIRSRNGIDQTAVDRTYQITGSGIFGIISPVLRNRRRIVTGSVTTLD